jgi:hypothetical protein
MILQEKGRVYCKSDKDQVKLVRPQRGMLSLLSISV